MSLVKIIWCVFVAIEMWWNDRICVYYTISHLSGTLAPHAFLVGDVFRHRAYLISWESENKTVGSFNKFRDELKLNYASLFLDQVSIEITRDRKRSIGLQQGIADFPLYILTERYLNNFF